MGLCQKSMEDPQSSPCFNPLKPVGRATEGVAVLAETQRCAWFLDVEKLEELEPRGTTNYIREKILLIWQENKK